MLLAGNKIINISRTDYSDADTISHIVNTQYHPLMFNKQPAKIDLQNAENKYVPILETPIDYKSYLLQWDTANVSDNEIQHVLKWTNARRLYIFGENAIAIKIQQFPNKLEEFKNLETIFVGLWSSTYSELRAHVFINSIKSLQRITFQVEGLTMDEFDEFVQNQTAPNGWKCGVYFQVFYKCEKI